MTHRQPNRACKVAGSPPSKEQPRAKSSTCNGSNWDQQTQSWAGYRRKRIRPSLLAQELGLFIEVHPEDEALDQHAKDMLQCEKRFLNVHRDCGGYHDAIVAEFCHAATPLPRQGDRCDALPASTRQGGNQILRVARGRDGEKHIPRLTKRFDLPLKDLVVAEIITGCGQDRGVRR